MANADSNRTRLGIVREDPANPGVIPTNPIFQLQRLTLPLTLGKTPNYVSSAEVRANRNKAQATKVSEDVGGGFSVELSYRSQEDLMDSLFFNNWRRSNERNGATQITAVSTTAFTVTSGTAFSEGQIIRTSGFTNDANNKVFTAGSGSSATSVVSTGLATETPSGFTPRIKVCGHEAAEADIAAAISEPRLTSTALDFTTLGLAEGQWIKIAGFTAATDNNAFVRIKTIEANTLTFDAFPTDWTADAGTGQTIKLYFGDHLTNGTTRISNTAEILYGAHDPANYIYFDGLESNTGGWTFGTDAIILSPFEFIGRESTDLDSTPQPGAQYKPRPDFQPLNGTQNIRQIRFNGQRAEGVSLPSQIQLNIDNGLTGQKALGISGNHRVNLGDFTCSGTITTYFEDETIYNLMLNNEAVSFDIALTDNDDHAMIFDVPACILNGGALDVSSNDSPMTLTPNFEAFGYTTQDGTEYSMSVGQIEYFE